MVSGHRAAGAAPGGGARGAGPRHAGRRALAAHGGRRSAPRGSPGAARPGRRHCAVSPRRLDLGAALGVGRRGPRRRSRGRARSCCSPISRPRAVSPAEPRVPLVVGRPDEPPPANVGIGAARDRPAALGRGRRAAHGDAWSVTRAAARPGERAARHAAGPAGAGARRRRGRAGDARRAERLVERRRGARSRRAPGRRPSRGRRAGGAGGAGELGFRRAGTSRRRARCSRPTAGSRAASEVTLGRLAPGSSIVQPPEDPAALGRAQPRARRARAWRGATARRCSSPRSPTAAPLVGRRPGAPALSAPAGRERAHRRARTAGGAPWLVRSGDVVLLGSRLDPAWTDLPVSAGFMPFMDVLVNRLARGEVSLADGAPGDPVPLPDLVTEVRQGERDWRVEGGGAVPAGGAGRVLPPRRARTRSARSARTSIRASRVLAPASDRQARRLWRGARHRRARPTPATRPSLAPRAAISAGRCCGPALAARRWPRWRWPASGGGEPR